MRSLVKVAGAALAAIAMTIPAANAAVTFDSSTGTGFVGKGDVQTALGWNNNQLQKNAASLNFTYSATTVQTTEWVCINENNGNEQERARTATATISGVAYSIARENSKGKDGPITGFFLTGFKGASTSSSTTDGPPLNSCPNANSTYALDSTVVGDPVVTGGGLYVNGVLLG